MVANKNCERRKCGEILVNIKTLKNKAKIFTFHCALCSIDCDQLKKFSKHLENHLQFFEHDSENSVEEVKDSNFLIGPEEIKVEEELNIELIEKGNCKIAGNTITSEDPLETEKSCNGNVEKLCNTQLLLATNVKSEKESTEQLKSCKTNDNSEDMLETTEIDCDPEENVNYTYPLLDDDSSSNDFSNYSTDADVVLEKELDTSKTLKISKDTKKKRDISKRSKVSTKETNENNTNKVSNDKKPKRRRRVIIETILPFLIQLYKKYKILWQVDDIAFGVKNKKYEIYGQIAEELKLEANEILSLEDINYHINYLNELYSKDKEQELKCEIEKREFLPEYEYYKDMSFLSRSQGPFLCTICNEILPRYHPYCQHMAQHNETQPFKCPSCGMMFTNYHKYLIHKKRHLGVYDFHCNICGKGYLFKNDLEWHVTSHTGDKPYLCQICGTGFRARHGYDNHIRRHEERFRHECHICKRGFNQLHALNNHVKSHLNIRDVICPICGKGFVHSKYLKRHELIHGKEKRYKCNECGKAFFQACGLRAHRKNHHS